MAKENENLDVAFSLYDYAIDLNKTHDGWFLESEKTCEKKHVPFHSCDHNQQ